MSKIDLSKAKIGDKFINKEGNVVEFIKFYSYRWCEYPYELKSELGLSYSVTNDGSFIEGEENPLDLVKQVFNGVAEAMPHIESAAIANLPREQLPENNEDDDELQSRQEVVELAEKMYIMFENENLRCNLSCDGSSIYCPEDLMEKAIRRAAFFIKKKNQYLKEGKL